MITTPEKTWDSLIAKIKEIKATLGVRKWNDPALLQYLEIIDTWVESNFDLDRTYNETVNFINWYNSK